MKKDVVKKWLRDEFCFNCHWYLKCQYQPKIIAQQTIKQGSCAAKIEWRQDATLSFVVPAELTCPSFTKPHVE